MEINTKPSASNKKSNETTLTHLTKRFVKLLNSSSERLINLNEASTRLNVAKRRIYDITNVLEGIGLMQKTSKNLARWVDCSTASPYAAKQIDSQKAPDAELLDLLKTHQALEEGMNDLEAAIKQQLSVNGAYVTYNDIKSSFNDQIVIAVKAPPETRLEVNESLQIWMKSENGAIEVYLCPQDGTTATTTTTTTNPSQQLQQQNGFQSDGQYYDEYNNDPTLSSAMSGEEETLRSDDPFRPLAFDSGSNYNYMMEETFSVSSLYDNNFGLYS